MTSKKRRCECLLHLDFSWHLGQLKISVGAEISGEVPDCRERVQGRGHLHFNIMKIQYYCAD